jgi:hypothetical protein
MDENRSTMWAKIAPHYRAILGMRIGRKMREGVPRIEDAPELAGSQEASPGDGGGPAGVRRFRQRHPVFDLLGGGI